MKPKILIFISVFLLSLMVVFIYFYTIYYFDCVNYNVFEDCFFPRNYNIYNIFGWTFILYSILLPYTIIRCKQEDFNNIIMKFLKHEKKAKTS